MVGSPNVTTNTEDTSKGYGHTRDVTIDVMAMSKATAAATARSQQTPTRKAAEQGKQKQTRNAQRKSSQQEAKQAPKAYWNSYLVGPLRPRSLSLRAEVVLQCGAQQ